MHSVRLSVRGSIQYIGVVKYRKKGGDREGGSTKTGAQEEEEEGMQKKRRQRRRGEKVVSKCECVGSRALNETCLIERLSDDDILHCIEHSSNVVCVGGAGHVSVNLDSRGKNTTEAAGEHTHPSVPFGS